MNSSNYPSATTQSQYIPQSNMGGANSPALDPKQTLFIPKEFDVRPLFEAFQKNNKVDLQDFLSTLTSTTMDKKCSIAVEKINNYMRTGNREADMLAFTNFFTFDLANKEDFMRLFKTLNKGEAEIRIEDLSTANGTYDLGLKPDQIKLMFDTLKKDKDTVKAADLYDALFKEA